MSHETVLLDRVDDVAVVTLNRPKARNALNMPMCLRLSEVFSEIDADQSIRAIILRAEGPTFCAGADLKERQDKDAAWVRQRRLASFKAYDDIAACTRPVIALLQGNIVGSGGEIAMSCDVVYAEENAVFRFPEVHWGTIGATQRLQRVIGKRKAKELLFTNGSLSAHHALELGLVQSIVSLDELRDYGVTRAQLMASAPSHSMAMTKKAIDMGEQVTLAQAIEIEMSFIEQNLASGKWKDGIKEFASNHQGPEVSKHSEAK